MPIPLRADFDACELRRPAKRSKDAAQTRRLLALAGVYDGASRTAAARIGGVTLQIVRDWVVKFNARGPAGLIDRKPPGPPSRLNEAHRAAWRVVVESGPTPAIHGVVPSGGYREAIPRSDVGNADSATGGFARATDLRPATPSSSGSARESPRGDGGSSTCASGCGTRSRSALPSRP